MSRKAEEKPKQSTTMVDVTGKGKKTNCVFVIRESKQGLFPKRNGRLNSSAQSHCSKPNLPNIETSLEVSPKHSDLLPPDVLLSSDILATLPSLFPILRQPTYPYYTAEEIAEVDFPTEIKLSIFMQLKKLILTFGQSVLEECVIAKFITFEEWNRLQGYYDDVKVDMEIKIGDEQQIEEWIDISSITYVDIDHTDLISLTAPLVTTSIQSSSPFSSSSSSSTTTPSTPASSSPTPSIPDLIQPCRKVFSASTEILIHSHNTAYKSDLLQKIFHYASVGSFYRPNKGQYFTRVTLPVPDVESIENLVNWVIGGDDENWVASIRPWSVWKVRKSGCKLGIATTYCHTVLLFNSNRYLFCVIFYLFLLFIRHSRMYVGWVSETRRSSC